jgi:hypothetical protein
MGLQNSKKKIIEEVNNFYMHLEDFECCICFCERKTKVKKVLCKHQICEKCFFKLKNDTRCPICRIELEPIDDKKKNKICYINDPYQENLDYDKKEILEQLDLFNVLHDDVELIKKNIGKCAVIGTISEKTVIIYFMPYYNNNWVQIIENVNGENKFLLFTLIDDLKSNNYDIWYNSQIVYDGVKRILDSIKI